MTAPNPPAGLIERLRGFEGSDDLGNGDFTICLEAIQAITALEARVKELEACLRDCADDLGTEIAARTQGFDVYPSMHRKAEADREVVRRARTALGGENALGQRVFNGKPIE